MYLLYDLIFLAATVLLIPYYLFRSLVRGKARQGIRERLAWYAPGRLDPISGRRVFWVHAVSVGETRAAIPLVRALKRAYPDVAIVLTNVTETGQEIAEGIREVDLCLFLPVDFSWVIRRALKRIRPELIVIVETEIWPNLVHRAKHRGIPVVLANGRISDRSFPRYRKLRCLFKPVLKHFSAFCMQSELDGYRIRAMGAQPEKIEVTRNLKFDMQARLPDAEEILADKMTFGLTQDAAVWVAGSTHAGEEDILLETYRGLLAEGRNLSLVLVPRHPPRCGAICEMIRATGLGAVLRSEVEGRARPLDKGEVLVVDTVGEMLRFYALADLVFVGGSLVSTGGHNVLEASLMKKPAVFGPHVHNFKEISTLLLGAGGGICVEDGQDLAAMVRRLLDDPQQAQAMGEKGFGLLERNSGATAHVMKVIARALEDRRG